MDACPICYADEPVEPVYCPRGHVHCAACLQAWSAQQAKKAHISTCPVCRTRIPAALRQQPLLRDEQTIARQQRPMRHEVFEVGDDVAWIPQALVCFLSSEQGQRLVRSTLLADYLEEMEYRMSMPPMESRLIRLPDDGTANFAHVVAVDALPIAGLHILHVRSAFAAHDAGGLGCASNDSSPYLLPVLDHRHCDSEQHVIRLEACAAAPSRSSKPQLQASAPSLSSSRLARALDPPRARVCSPSKPIGSRRRSCRYTAATERVYGTSPPDGWQHVVLAHGSHSAHSA
jgi:hypothetical protein